MKLRRVLYGGGASLLLLVVFTIDMIRKNVELGIGGLSITREMMIIAAFAFIYLALEDSDLHRELSPIKKLGIVLIYAVLILLIAGVFVFNVEEGFESKNYALLPLGYGTIFLSTFLSLALGIFALLVIRMLRDLILQKRKKGTQRNFLVLTSLAFATSGSAIVLEPLESSIFTNILLGVAILFAIVNSFRQSWIVYLTKREKIFSLIYGFLLFGCFLLLNILIAQAVLEKSILYYSHPLEKFISVVVMFGNIYFGMTFISTLFHLPTAEAFDRKTTEISSLHNLSRLVTQVFDFNELMDTVTTMTLQVCEARSCWLEIIQYSEEYELPGTSPNGRPAHDRPAGVYEVNIAGIKNIDQSEINVLLPMTERTVRDVVIEERQPVVVNDLGRDPRFRNVDKTATKVISMVVVPLISHSGLVGILYATKDMPHGFFKDDVDVISAFADQATIAIENSRLIKKSIERERLLREMMVAQEIQKKLLPQSLPRFSSLDIDAVSTPAFEVGGDYYDFVELDGNTLGIVVGDVSGKGVSAAFYMSEVKGIFQSLSRLYPSPREFMLKANEALASSIDKHSFVSLIYAVINVRTGRLTLSRAGHCPLLHISGDTVQYLRPTGMGLGLAHGEIFAESIEEQTIHLQHGDVCVFYTDGLTEARRGDDEFGYDRLLQAVIRSKQKPAAQLKEDIVETVKTHVAYQPNDDDLTLVVLKWLGENGTS